MSSRNPQNERLKRVLQLRLEKLKLQEKRADIAARIRDIAHQIRRERGR